MAPVTMAETKDSGTTHAAGSARPHCNRADRNHRKQMVKSKERMFKTGLKAEDVLASAVSECERGSEYSQGQNGGR